MDAWNEGGKNRWRYKEGSDQKVIEIELTQGKVAWIDAERLEEVQQHKWHTYSSKKHNTFYVRTEIRTEDNKITRPFLHIFLFPNIIPPRDHIDRNGLNNTSANIRCGANGINERNRNSRKRELGIMELPHRKRYEACWCEADGRKMSKLFSWSKYESKEAAFEAAALFRKVNNDRVIKELESINNDKTKTIAPRYKPTPIQPKSGLKNIVIRHEGSKASRACVEIVIDKKRFSKSFSASMYGNDLSNAISAAQEWLESIKTQNIVKKREREDE